MKYLKLFEYFKEVIADDYYNIDNAEYLNKREIDIIQKFANENKWDFIELTSDSNVQLEFSKKNSDYLYRITIERQYDEYYLASIDFECMFNPRKDNSRYFILDTYDELLEFLKKVEKFYNHKRLYDIRRMI